MSKILDSAFVIAAISATLYYFGQASVAGHANGLGLPVYFLKQDIWETLMGGAQILVGISVLLPVHLFGEDGFRYEVILSLIAMLVVFAILYWALRLSRYRIYALCIWLLVGLSFPVFLFSSIESSEHMRRSGKCLSESKSNNCAEAEMPARVVFAISTDLTEEHIGVILRINSSFLVMLTKDGLLTVPVTGIRLL